jgi:DNA-binding CsgD family transcriptional regulator
MAHSIDTSVVLPVIGRIYDAALDAKVWPDVISQIVRLQGADKSMLFTPFHTFQQGGFNFRVGMPENAIQQWADKYAAHDIWAQAGLEKGLGFEGNILTDADLVPQETLHKSIFYREYLSKFGIERVCTGMVFGTQSPPYPATVLSVFRDINAPEFGARERTLHGVLIPHISRAMGIMFRLRDAELKVASTLAGLDNLTSAILLIGIRGDVVYANRSSRRLLLIEDGLRLRANGSGQTLLAADSSNGQHSINTAIMQCTQGKGIKASHFSSAVSINRPSGRAPYTLNFSALSDMNEFATGLDQPFAIAILNDPDEPVRVDAEVLKRLYALTAAECRLASQLCSGETLSTIAKNLGVSENTVKTQLQSIFDKTETRRQVQLVKLLVGLGSTNTY